jgi:inner membrane protein
MPTILTQTAVPIARAMGLGRDGISRRLLVIGIVASLLPDLDVFLFRLGMPHVVECGHLGFSHSVLLAFLVGFPGSCLFQFWGSRFLKTFCFLFAATVSHAMLDALTTGGPGIAFSWPWSAERYFAPVPIIEVAPLALTRFLSPRGATVLRSEFLWVWLPLMPAVCVSALVRYHWKLRADVGSRLADGNRCGPG